VFFEIAAAEKKKLLIETHSDYIIDRFRLNYRDRKGKTPEAQVMFFERVNGGNKLHLIPIEKNGEYSENQPDSFRRFFLDEQRKILGF
jgi:predicted ATPase